MQIDYIRAYEPASTPLSSLASVGQTNVAAQGSTSEPIDYSQFQGPTLADSGLVDYGFSGLDGYSNLMAQNPNMGAVDFLNAIDFSGATPNSAPGFQPSPSLPGAAGSPLGNAYFDPYRGSDHSDVSH